MNYEYARANLIVQQIMPWHVPDKAILELLASVPREQFMPPAYKQLAFADLSIPLAHNQTTLPPKIEGRLLQALQIKATDKILEIGSGSAYLTALLAKCGRRVVSVEIYPELAEAASAKLSEHAIYNVTLECGDGIHGWHHDAPYDVIVLTGSVFTLEDGIKQQLNVGGRLFAVTGVSPVMHAKLITRVGDHDWDEVVLFETALPALQNSTQKASFSF